METYDIPQIQQSLETLELNLQQTTESEKVLRVLLHLHKSPEITHYVEHPNAVSALLECCIDLTKNELDLYDQFDVVYNLLRNDFYKYKSKEIKENSVYFNEVDQLEFFNFLYRLYNDPDFKRTHSIESLDKPNTQLRSILIILTRNHLQSIETNKELNSEISAEALLSFHEKMQETLGLLGASLVSAKLKLLYLKPTQLFDYEDAQIIKEICFKPDKIVDLNEVANAKDFKKNLKFIKNFGTHFLSFGSVASTFGWLSSAYGFQAPKILELSLYSLSASAFSESKLVKKILRNDSQTKTPLTIEIEQEYLLKRQELYRELATSIKYSDEIYKDLIELHDKNAEFPHISASELRNYSKLKKLFEELNQKIEHLNDEESILIDLQKPTTKVVSKNQLDILVAFKHFSVVDRKQLSQFLELSEENLQNIKKVVRASKSFGRNLKSVKSFKELVELTHENLAQNFLYQLLKEVDSVVESNTIKRALSS